MAENEVFSFGQVVQLINSFTRRGYKKSHLTVLGQNPKLQDLILGLIENPDLIPQFLSEMKRTPEIVGHGKHDSDLGRTQTVVTAS